MRGNFHISRCIIKGVLCISSFMLAKNRKACSPLLTPNLTSHVSKRGQKVSGTRTTPYNSRVKKNDNENKVRLNV